jgi:Domain of unknown function (DUF1844)
MSDEQTSFKVTDRRLFNADGSPRELSPEEKKDLATAEASSVATSVAASTQTAQSSDTRSTTPTSEAKAPTAEASQGDSEEDFEMPDSRDPASFVNFIMSIASNAASALGMMEHPVTRQREVDLELAKHWIDVLGMLKQKTRGNLTKQEQEIVDNLLSDLRMQFVSFAERAEASAPPAYTGRDIIGGK